MMRSPLGLAVLALAIGGCAPSLTNSLRERRYDDAICAAAASRNPLSAHRVGEALSRELHATVHVHALTPAEIDLAFASRMKSPTPVGLEGYQLVRFVYSANRLPSVPLKVSITLFRYRTALQVIGFSRYEDLLAITHELAPAPRAASRTVERGMDATEKNILALPVLILVNPISIGLFRKPVYFKSEPNVQPTLPLTDSDWESAPQTYALRNTFVTPPCSDSTTGPCEMYFALQKPEEPDGLLSLEVHLELGPLARPKFKGGCRLDVYESITLPNEGTLATRIATRFGDRGRTLDELGASMAVGAELLDGR